MADHIGEQLGNYRLLRLLGQGGFATVYLGEHIYLKSQAALKILHTRLGKEETAHFLQEAQLLARLSHPHIVRVLDFAVQEGLPFLVMEYAPGGTLRTLHSKQTRVPLSSIVAYVSQVASALQYAHEQRLLHRDVKPENMLLDAQSQVLLADFGLALLLSPTPSASTLAMGQPPAGTSPYLAPEQLQGQPGPASDQYALAVVVYEWLTGKPPFWGSWLEIAMQHLSVPPPPLRTLLPDLSPALEEVVLRALAKEPKDRFAHVRDFASAFVHACEPTSPPLWASVPSTASQARPSTLRAEPLWKVPTSLRPLLGREQEVAAIGALLCRSEVRLVTLLGTGGVGKTRLSLEVATQLRAAFADGVCFVGLAAISDPELVLPTLAHELGVQEGGMPSLLEQMKVVLQDKQLLLLLDNFEQVAPAAVQVAELLAACPRLKVLMTSRVVLHVQGEYQFPVPPLALPPLTPLPADETLAQYAAVALFLERARALKPDFQLTAANTRAIAEICVHLDGLPLAIELAAARIKLLPPQALLRRLSPRLAVLTGGARDVPARQQTLRNTIQWSYDLLEAEEQRLFRRLSVFVDGCRLSAAEAVCDPGGNASVGLAGSVLDGVASLIDKSLLHQTEQEGEEPRLAMLETIREYGRECLVASGEAEVIQRAHAAYYLALAEEAEPRMTGAGMGSWLERLQREHENLRAALAWLGEHNEQEAALQLGGALWRFWLISGHLSEGRSELARALAASEQVEMSVRAKALCAAGALAERQGDFAQAEVLCGQSLALFRALDDPRGSGTSLIWLGYAAWQQSNYAVARSQLEEALALCREVDDQDGIALALSYLATVFLLQGEYDRARTLAEEAVVLNRERGDTWCFMQALWISALVISFEGDFTQAHALLSESLALSRQEGYKQSIAYSLYGLGTVAVLQRNIPKAQSLLEESLALFKEVGDRQNIAQSLSGLAWVSLIQGDYAAARSLLEESLTLFKAVGNKWFIAGCLVAFAALAAAVGEWTRAVQLSGAAEALCKAINGVLIPGVYAMQEFAIATARAQLGEEIFAAAWAEGRTMTLEQVLAAQGPVSMPTTAPAGPSSVPHAPKAPTSPAGLTAREVEVLCLVAQGLTDAQVAEQLVISPRTVNWHLTSIYSKLQVSSRAAATRYAIEHHLL